MDKKPPKIITYIFPTFGNILWLMTFIMVLRAGRRMMNGDGDLGFHITLGRYILENGNIPSTDLFSHTMIGQPVVEHEWLAGVIFAAIERILGINGVILFCALIISTSFWLVYKLLRRESRTLLIPVLITAIAVATSMVHWLARPHIFTFLILPLWLIILGNLYRGKLKLWWMLPIIMLIWANLHGVFVVGIITWFVYGFGIVWDQYLFPAPDKNPLPVMFWRYYALGGIASFLTSLINPYGFRLWQMIFSHVGSRFLTDNTQEFMSPNFHNIEFWPFLIYIGLLVIILGLSKKRWQSNMLFTTAFWLAMGLYGGRNVPLFGIAAAPLLAIGVEDLFLEATRKFSFLNKINEVDNRIQETENLFKGTFLPVVSVIFVLVGLIMGFRFDVKGLGYAFDPEVFPVDAADWIEDHPQNGEMFNTFDWGGYLQYRLWPDKLVFIDSKSHLYGEEFVIQYLETVRAEDGWDEVLNQYNISWAILPPEAPISEAIQEDLGWKRIYEDETSVILRKP